MSETAAYSVKEREQNAQHRAELFARNDALLETAAKVIDMTRARFGVEVEFRPDIKTEIYSGPGKFSYKLPGVVLPSREFKEGESGKRVQRRVLTFIRPRYTEDYGPTLPDPTPRPIDLYLNCFAVCLDNIYDNSLFRPTERSVSGDDVRITGNTVGKYTIDGRPLADRHHEDFMPTLKDPDYEDWNIYKAYPAEALGSHMFGYHERRLQFGETLLAEVAQAINDDELNPLRK